MNPSPDTSAPGRGAVLGLLLVVQVAFASLSVVGKVTLGAVPWPALVLLRTLGALGVFVLWGMLRGEALVPPRGQRSRMLLLGALGVFANQVCFLSGLARTTAVNATVLVATIPLFTALFSVLLGREPLRPRFAQGTALALVGLLLVVRPERAGFGGQHLLGDLLIVTNSAAYGLYLALARDAVLQHGGPSVVRWAFGAGALFALPIGLLPAVHTVTHASPRVLGALGYILVVPTAFAYAANAWALGRVPASVVSVFIYLQPAFAAVMAVTVSAPLAGWLGVPAPAEGLGLRTVVGGLVTLAGVALATRK